MEIGSLIKARIRIRIRIWHQASRSGSYQKGPDPTESGSKTQKRLDINGSGNNGQYDFYELLDVVHNIWSRRRRSRITLPLRLRQNDATPCGSSTLDTCTLIGTELQDRIVHTWCQHPALTRGIHFYLEYN
jgi:hypothetical protein